MKLCLLSIVLLLVPLVFAKAPLSSSFTFLYDNQAGRDYVISEGHWYCRMKYEYSGDKLEFITLDQTPKQYGEDQYIALNVLKNQNVSFAIDFVKGKGTCQQISSTNLRDLIHKCSNEAAIRELTEDERNRIEDYKAEQKVSNELFEVAYERYGEKRVRAKSVGQKQFHVSLTETSTTRSTLYYPNVFLDAVDDIHSRYRHMSFDDEMTKGYYGHLKPVSIHGLPIDADVNCWRGGAAQVYIRSCAGQTVLNTHY